MEYNGVAMHTGSAPRYDAFTPSMEAAMRIIQICTILIMMNKHYTSRRIHYSCRSTSGHHANGGIPMAHYPAEYLWRYIFQYVVGSRTLLMLNYINERLLHIQQRLLLRSYDLAVHYVNGGIPTAQFTARLAGTGLAAGHDTGGIPMSQSTARLRWRSISVQGRIWHCSLH